MQKKLKGLSSLEKNKKIMTSSAIISEKTKTKSKTPEKKKDPIKQPGNKEVKKIK